MSATKLGPNPPHSEGDVEDRNTARTGGWSRWYRRVREQKTEAIAGDSRRRAVRGVVLFFVFLGILPAILSPAHPIAVYGYLAEIYVLPKTKTVHASSNIELTTYLLTPDQVARYRDDLRADMLDRTTGRLFAIVQYKDGSYAQEPIRTWNGFFPKSSPRWMTRWLDRKELPFLSDEVAIWLADGNIVAMGHYHAFGGEPSAGDRAAQWFSSLAEIVVVNSLIPIVYVDGEVVRYGEDAELPKEVHRALQVVEPSLLMPPTQFLPLPGELNAATYSLLGYLEAYRQVDVSDLAAVVAAIEELRLETVTHLEDVFDKGIYPENYPNDLDREVYARHLDTLEGWVARMHTVMKRNRLLEQ